MKHLKTCGELNPYAFSLAHNWGQLIINQFATGNFPEECCLELHVYDIVRP